jgi:hypothetical protein
VYVAKKKKRANSYESDGVIWPHHHVQDGLWISTLLLPTRFQQRISKTHFPHKHGLEIIWGSMYTGEKQTIEDEKDQKFKKEESKVQKKNSTAP